ncbi:MAG: hypothetical protein IJ644_07775 [Oscillospiraceae bacterium]|nr:hypothetical protein [Oscillospiraceae bacterium]
MYDVRQIKRIFAVISLNTVLLSTGCTVVQTTPQKIANPMTGGFTAEVTITNADSESKATLTRYGTDAWCVLFSEPQTLAGVQLDFLDDEVKASYKGLEFSVPQSAQAIRTELEDLMNIIDDMALSPDLNGKTEENKIICEGDVEEGSYTLTFTEAGIPAEFSLPCYGVVIVFDSFTPQTGTNTAETAIPEASETIPMMTEPSVTETAPAEQAVIPEPIPAEPAAVIEDSVPE